MVVEPKTISAWRNYELKQFPQLSLRKLASINKLTLSDIWLIEGLGKRQEAEMDRQEMRIQKEGHTHLKQKGF